MASDNKTLGNFQLTNILPARRGVPQIEVKFDIDANGIVHVTAKDLGTNKEQSITITSSTNLTDDEIEKMRKEAEENKEADEKRKEETEIRNKAETLISDIDISLQEKGDSIDPAQKEQTQKLRDELKQALDNNDIETLKKRISELEQAAAYMSQQQTGQQQGNGTPGTNPDDVVDADFNEKNNA
jgi:molecular chaperone DnaK